MELRQLGELEVVFVIFRALLRRVNRLLKTCVCETGAYNNRLHDRVPMTWTVKDTTQLTTGTSQTERIVDVIQQLEDSENNLRRKTLEARHFELIVD